MRRSAHTSTRRPTTPLLRRRLPPTRLPRPQRRAVLARTQPQAAGKGWALFTGDAADVIDSLPTASVQSIITSPPYFNLRNYRNHPDQLGQEPTPDHYVERLANVLNRAARVLRPDGTLWLNIADTYASRANNGTSSDRHPGRGHRTGVMPTRIATTSTAPLKSLLLIPARVALSLQTAGWIVRNDIIWHKTNAMPMSATDRLSNRHEHIFLLTRSPNYYFDLDSVRQPAQNRASGNKRRSDYATSVGTDAAARRFGANTSTTLNLPHATRNPGDVWSIATRGTSDDHYAMFPPELPRRCILASTRPGDVVLDPFAGRSTTGRAALELGRRYLGIDLNAEDNEAAAQHLSR